MSKPTRLVIENKGTGGKHEKQFFLDIQDAIIDGYRISESTKNIDSTMRNYMGFMGRAVLVLPEGQPKVEPKVEAKVGPRVGSPEEYSQAAVDKLTKKKDLIAYAKSFGFDVPSALTAPMQIKKAIKEHFTK